MVLPESFNIKPSTGLEEIKIAKKEDFCDYAYDFIKNELKTQDGKHYYVYGNEALKIWIYKCMLTDRFRYLAYSSQFGTEVYTLIGDVVSDRFKKEEIKRYLMESLMAHPFIVSVNKIELTTKKHILEATVYFTSVFENRMEYVLCTVPI